MKANSRKRQIKIPFTVALLDAEGFIYIDVNCQHYWQRVWLERLWAGKQIKLHCLHKDWPVTGSYYVKLVCYKDEQRVAWFYLWNKQTAEMLGRAWVRRFTRRTFKIFV